jgi:spore coat polysaccharide biosynthesis protein SpsF
MIVAIIQARMGSSRLPGKIMLKACDKTFLEHMIDRISQSKTLDKIVIATSINKDDDVIENFCKEKNIFCFRGPENDVLSRYKMAADETQADTIVRLTSDTPLLHSTIIDKVVETYIGNNYDYVSNCFPLPRTYPDGMNVEVFSKEILDEIHNNAKKPSEREHVTLFLVFKPDKYKIFRVDYEKDVSKYRFNLDYKLDYELLKTIFEKLYSTNHIFTMEDAIKLLEDNSSIFQINSEIEPYQGMLKSFVEDEAKGFTKSENFFKK